MHAHTHTHTHRVVRHSWRTLSMHTHRVVSWGRGCFRSLHVRERIRPHMCIMLTETCSATGTGLLVYRDGAWMCAALPLSEHRWSLDVCSAASEWDGCIQ